MEMRVEEITLVFIDVANDAMYQPIPKLTKMKGHETSKHNLA